MTKWELALRDSNGQAPHRQLPKAKTPHGQESSSTRHDQRQTDRLADIWVARIDRG
jgi:hypothetical protein